MNEEDKRRKKYRWLLLALAVIIPFVCAAYVRVVFLKSGENCVDAYYHAAMADLGPSYCVSKKFPAMTMSAWKDKFSDKEILYHVLLSVLRKAQEYCGFSTSPPFTFPALFFVFLLIFSFVLTARSFGCSHIIIFSFLLVLMCPAFLSRILMLRPHTAAIAFMIYSCVQFREFRKPNAFPRGFIMGFIFAWLYSSPHFLLIPATAFAIAGVRKNGIITSILMPASVTAGILSGLIFHPQFPNTFINWKIQSFDVLKNIFFHSYPGDIANECMRPEMWWWGWNGFIIMLFALNIFMFARVVKKQGLKNISPDISAMMIISAISILQLFFIQRAVEYACPFTVLSLAILFTASKDAFPKTVRNYMLCSIIGILLLCGWNTYRSCFTHYRTQLKPLNDFKKWAETTKLQEGTPIANVSWGEFPLLFYSAPDFRYLSGIDPMFSYYSDPERFRKIEEFRTGRLKMNPKELAELTGARYAFATFHSHTPYLMLEQGYAPVFQSPEGLLFDLRLENRQQEKPKEKNIRFIRIK